MTLSAEERREQRAPLLSMMMVIIQRCPGDSHVVLKSEDYREKPYIVQNIFLQDKQFISAHVRYFYFFNI